MKTYTRETLEKMEKEKRNNQFYIKIIIIIATIIIMFLIFFIGRYSQWHSGTHMRREEIFNGGNFNNGIFNIPRAKEVDAYDLETLEFIGEVTVVIDY